MLTESFDYFNWILLPLLIFLSRLTDVTLATLRHIFVSKGFRKIVPLLGFVEVLLWLVAMRQVFHNLNNVACFFAWAGGFAMGTYCGMLIEERLALGLQIIRIITDKDCSDLVEKLRTINQGVTVLNAEGAKGPVKIIFTIVKRTHKKNVLELIRNHDQNAFYSVEDVKNASHGVFSADKNISPFKRIFSSN